MSSLKVTQKLGCLLLAVLLAQPSIAMAATAGAAHANSRVATPRIDQILPASIVLAFPQQISKLYTASHMQPLWQNQQVKEAFLLQLNELALAGVSPRFTQWVKELSNPKLSEMAKDIVLSDAMLGYLSYVDQIKAKGDSWLYTKTTPVVLATPTEKRIMQWLKAKDNATELAFINSLAPQNRQYALMQKALARLIHESDEGWPQLGNGPSLRPGDSNPDVAVLDHILQLTGYLPDAVTDVSDDVYSGTRVDAVENFQRQHGLEADGVIGPRTRFWLNQDPQTRAALLALNMQRLRLLPTEKVNGIWVNIPDYHLAYYRGGKEILDSKVIVGRPTRKTPFMHSQLNNVVLNPPWTVPDRLIREDLIPKIKRDPSYLAKHGYVILSDWTNEAYEISPYDIDWSKMSDKNFPYRLKQAPGDDNSLGRYKFNMPNSDAIYLHDTPSKGLFGKDIRALSSGCIRVNKAAQLADMLLKDVGWNQERVSSTLNKGKTTYVPIRERVPVQIYYLSSWVADSGQVQYRTDIYDYDKVSRASTLIRDNLRTLLN
ncbi:MAG: L,D-transpeptidase [Plesiomonas sp.]|uniref:L,D-transpeptidase n=1 Tax=Plesiomonas sp. TaxID=2486279 RepID=UPI003F2C8E37